jgi:glycosyltransferase involved in cell wall biosynthesis
MAERLAREGGFEDRAIFLGNVAAIEKILPAARLALLPRTPSRSASPRSRRWRAACRWSARAAGGLPEVVDDGRNGFLRPVGDVDGMAAAAVELLSTPSAGAASRPDARPPRRDGVPDGEAGAEVSGAVREDAGGVRVSGLWSLVSGFWFLVSGCAGLASEG